MRRLAALLAVLACAAACSSGSKKIDLRGTSGKDISHAADIAVPSSLRGLAVTPEDVTKTVADSQRAYIDSLVMYGLRKGTLLQATFQVSRFNAGTKYSSPKFRQAVVDQIGTETPVTIDVAGQTVYVTVGNRQRIWIWFKSSYLFVLAARDDYPSPRTLLRDLLAVGP